jgi:hypothetical protein
MPRCMVAAWAAGISNANGSAEAGSIVMTLGAGVYDGAPVVFDAGNGFGYPVRVGTAADFAGLGLLTNGAYIEAATVGGLTPLDLTGGLASAASVTGLATKAEVTNHLQATGGAAHAGMVTNNWSGTIVGENLILNNTFQVSKSIAIGETIFFRVTTNVGAGSSAIYIEDSGPTENVLLVSKIDNVGPVQIWKADTSQEVCRVDAVTGFVGNASGLTNIPSQYVFSDPAPAIGIFTIASTTESRTVRKVRTHALVSGSAVADLCTTAWTSGATVAGTTLATLTFSTTAQEYSITGAWAVADSLRLNVTNVASGTTNLTMEAFTW